MIYTTPPGHFSRLAFHSGDFDWMKGPDIDDVPNTRYELGYLSGWRGEQPNLEPSREWAMGYADGRADREAHDTSRVSP